ncbi:MAG TPA: hypothetical protein VMV49_05045 [Candidatus Deferrimicrobium sp.]|nr:hypothetical protein [Candidatus Deferrimicrobium sp.]
MDLSRKEPVEEIISKLTAEQRRLLYLIGLYSEVEGEVGKQWLKDLSLKGILVKGVREKVFDWDYAPASIMYRNTRKVINISQEGQNDLNTLRTYGLIARLRLGTSRHFYFNAYGLTAEGVEVFSAIPQEDREPIEKLISCPKCGKLYEVIPEEDSIYLTCEKCDIQINTEVDDIEAVAYMCVPKWLRMKIETVWKPVTRRE